MSWTTYFNSSPNPSSFDPAVTSEVLNEYQATQLDDFINKVITKLNDEARLINPNALYDLAKVRSLSAQNWDSLTNTDKFNLVVTSGETILNQEKNSTLTTSKIFDFYKKYYFRTPTTAEIQALQANPYGLGVTTEKQLQTQAINSLASYGIINKSEYENLTPEEQIAKLNAFVNDRSQVEAAALKVNNGIIDSDKISLSPSEAITALIQLKDQGVVKLNTNNTYSYLDGKSVDNLAEVDNGKWLTSYQLLEKKWRDSGSTQPFSTYLANQQAFRAENERVKISTTSDYALELSGTLDQTLADKIAAEVGSPETKLTEIQSKIEKLKADAYKQAYSQLSLYQSREQQQKDMDALLGDSMSSFTTQLSQDLGVKSDFFKASPLNSSSTYGWQRWFETELAKRYDPNNTNNRIASVLGSATAEDISIASGFINDFLRKRFDGSKSLAEFTSYIEPGASTPLLEKGANVAWNQYSNDNYYSLLGNITDPNSNLGNFWNLLQTGWREGVGFNTTFYKDQQVLDSNQKAQTVENLWNGIKSIHELAIQKNTTDLKPTDFDANLKSALGVSTDEELINKINEYRAWWNKAFEYGSDIEDIDQFMKLHYNVYKQDLIASNPTRLVVTPEGSELKVNTQDTLKQQDQEKIQRMAENLAYEATRYIDQIQFGEFMTPEEYVKTMMSNSNMSDIFGNTALDGSSETDIIKGFTQEFAGVISSYAGEQIRNNIRMLLEQNKAPDQSLLGVEYIERTKEQALATIRNIIRGQSESSAVVASNIQAPAPGESLTAWFRGLGLEIVPGKTWEQFKTANNISGDITFEEWERYYGNSSDLGQKFWNQWTADNGIQMEVVGGKINLIISNPSSAWKTWGNNIVNAVNKQDSNIISALNGASVDIKTGELNKSWYSKTNPYTKVLDDWKKATRYPTGKVVNISGTGAWKWAKENKIDPSGAWRAYVTEKRKTNSRFAKNAAGDDMSFEDWSASAKSYEVDSFWQSTNSYWIQYLKDKGIASSDSSESNLKIKTWQEWATANNVDLATVMSSTSAPIPNAFLDLHYNTLGGKSRVDEEYLDVYFPEFKMIESQKKNTSIDMPFDLSSFGLEELNTDSKSMLSDFDQFDPFKSISGDFGFDITNPNSVDTFDSKNTVDIKGDMNFGTSINTLTKKRVNTDYTQNFSGDFGDFGGFNFGF